MIKYKIVATHSKKGKIEIPISKRLLHKIAHMPFIMDDCKYCWNNFRLNKMDKEVKRLHDIILFLTFDVDSDGLAYEMIKPKKKTEQYKFKKIKSDFVLIKKPKWNK